MEYSRAAFSTPERKRRGRGDRRSQEIRNPGGLIIFQFSKIKKKLDSTRIKSLSLQKTFESVILTSLYPRSAISIFVEVLQADGCKSFIFKF